MEEKSLLGKIKKGECIIIRDNKKIAYCNIDGEVKAFTIKEEVSTA